MQRTLMNLAICLAMFATMAISCDGDDDVGSFIKIWSDVVEVNGDSTTSNSKILRADDEVVTVGSGDVDWKLDAKVKKCKSHLVGTATVHPSAHPDALASFTSGSHWCQSKVGADCDGRCEFHAPGVSFTEYAQAGDPVFGVEIEGERVTIKVDRGVMTVRTADGVVQVPAGFETLIIPGRPPTPPTEIIIPPGINGLLAELRELDPLPDISTPSVDSELLALALEGDDGLVLWVDEARLEEPGTNEFIARFAGQLQAEWGVNVPTAFTSLEEVVFAVEAGVPGLFVTPEGPGGWAQTLLFVDPAGLGWNIAAVESEAIMALHDFVLATTQIGIYGRLYFDAFGQAPNLAIVEEPRLP